MTRRLPTAAKLGLTISAGPTARVPTGSRDLAPAELGKLLASRAIAKSATDVVLLDVAGITAVTSYFLVCTGANPRLLHAIVDVLVTAAKTRFGVPPVIEGRDGNDWVLLDFGSVVAHVFSPEARSFYQLERLWADAPLVEVAADELGVPALEQTRQLAD